METKTIQEIQETIEFLKKDNVKNFKKAKKEGMVYWDIEKVKYLVEIYLNSVLISLHIEQKGGLNSSQA